jgi:hypothetical protein
MLCRHSCIYNTNVPVAYKQGSLKNRKNVLGASIKSRDLHLLLFAESVLLFENIS